MVNETTSRKESNMYKPSKLNVAIMALIMAEGWLWKAKQYARGEHIQPKTWSRAVEIYGK